MIHDDRVCLQPGLGVRARETDLATPRGRNVPNLCERNPVGTARGGKSHKKQEAKKKVSIHKYLIINKIEYVAQWRDNVWGANPGVQASQSGPCVVVCDLLIDYTNLFVYLDLSR